MRSRLFFLLFLSLFYVPAGGNRRVRRVAPARRRDDDSGDGFNSDGRLPQVEYAEAAANRGQLCVAIAVEGGVCLAVEAEPLAKLRRPLRPTADDEYLRDLRSSALDKMIRISPSCVAVFAGMAPDARYLCFQAQEESAGFWQTFGVDMDAARLADRLAMTAASYDARYGGRGRPLGTALLLADAADLNELHGVLPSGVATRSRALAIGRGSEAVQRFLDSALEEMGVPTMEEAALICEQAFQKVQGAGGRRVATALQYFMIVSEANTEDAEEEGGSGFLHVGNVDTPLRILPWSGS